jgi:hypothetical protein
VTNHQDRRASQLPRLALPAGLRAREKSYRDWPLDSSGCRSTAVLAPSTLSLWDKAIRFRIGAFSAARFLSNYFPTAIVVCALPRESRYREVVMGLLLDLDISQTDH